MSGQVKFAGPVAWVSLVCMVELRWIGRFLVKMVGSGSAGQVRFSRLDLVRSVWSSWKVKSGWVVRWRWEVR